MDYRKSKSVYLYAYICIYVCVCACTFDLCVFRMKNLRSDNIVMSCFIVKTFSSERNSEFKDEK